MQIININGPINAGKTTISKLLSDKLPEALFIEVDDLLSDEEQDSLGLDFRGGISLRLDRLDVLLDKVLDEGQYKVIIFAYPISENNYDRWQNVINNRADLKIITLAPKLEDCLINRGNRELTDWEVNRIKEMYAQNYHCPEQSDFIINNSNQSPQDTVGKIVEFLK